MKNLLALLILTVCFASCNSPNTTFEKDFYEKISSIKLPDKYKVIETVDNGEFVTTTSFNIDSVALIAFIKTNHFDTLNLQCLGIPFIPYFFGNNYLKKQKPDLTKENEKNIYFISRTKNKNSWLYIADIQAKMLWAEIQYPDWGGK